MDSGFRRKSDGRFARPAEFLEGLISLAVEALAQHLAIAADRLGLFARPSLGRLLVGAAHLHLPEDAFALHPFLEHAQRLIDIVFADENLHERATPSKAGTKKNATQPQKRGAKGQKPITSRAG